MLVIFSFAIRFLSLRRVGVYGCRFFGVLFRAIRLNDAIGMCGLGGDLLKLSWRRSFCLPLDPLRAFITFAGRAL